MVIMYQEWRDLLFLHWKQPEDVIKKTIPKELIVDTFLGDAYITLIPFVMPKVSIAKNITIPGLNNFLEVNMRTYVRDHRGNAGIWFYSLDINSSLASVLGRHLFHLPYEKARFSVESFNNTTNYRMHRLKSPYFVDVTHQREATTSYRASLGSLDDFLIERYILFTSHKGKVLAQRVRHVPYPLFQVSLKRCEHNFVNLPRQNPDLIHFSSGVDVDLLPMRLASDLIKQGKR